jgi:class 3 adenylate cyclase/TolB-like protein/Flp pilus assembly protein TadD
MTAQGTEQRRLAAIMFTDMVGYTALTQRNETLALELLEEQRALLRGLFPSFNGREVETTGDGFLLEFASALEAARCAIEIQRALATRNISVGPERQIQLRIGIHVGDIVHREGHVLGDGVNIAARLQPLAPPGGICISVDVARQVQNNLEATVVRLGEAELKNVRLPMEICRIVLPWEQITAPTTPALAGASPSPVPQVTQPPATTRMPILSRQLVVVLGLLLLGILGSWLWMRGGRSPSQLGRTAGPIKSLAVKPLDDFSGDTNQAYLSDGMTEALCAALGNISALRVPGRSSVMRFKGTQKTIQEMARELNVDAMVEGSVQRASNRLLITLQLVEAATDRHLWATNFERDLGDFFKVQTEIAQALAQEVQVRLTPEDRTRLARAKTVNRDALEAYLIGMHHWWNWSYAETTNALGYFQRAIALDAGYAPAYAGASLAYQWTPGDPAITGPKARQAAERAVQLDPEFSDGFAARGNVRALYDWDWPGAEADLRRAIQLNPKSSLALDLYNNFLTIRGRFGEAVAVLEQALENDPLAAGLHSDLGFTLTVAHRDAEAVTHLRKSLELDPNFEQAHGYLGGVYWRLGQITEAEAEFLAAVRDEPMSVMERYHLAEFYAATGKKEDARKVVAQADQLAKASYVSPCNAAVRHLALGETEAALDSLESACAHRDPLLVVVYRLPAYDSLRDQPRFQALARKIQAGGREK